MRRQRYRFAILRVFRHCEGKFALHIVIQDVKRGPPVTLMTMVCQHVSTYDGLLDSTRSFIFKDPSRLGENLSILKVIPCDGIVVLMESGESLFTYSLSLEVMNYLEENFPSKKIIFDVNPIQKTKIPPTINYEELLTKKNFPDMSRAEFSKLSGESKRTFYLTTSWILKSCCKTSTSHLLWE